MPKIYKITEADKKPQDGKPSRMDQIIRQEFEHRSDRSESGAEASMMIDPQGGDKFEELTWSSVSLSNEHTLHRKNHEAIKISQQNLFESFKAGFFTASSSNIKPLQGSYVTGYRGKDGQEYLILNETVKPKPNYQKLLDPSTFPYVDPTDEKQKPPPLQKTTCYTLLKLQPNASATEIHSAYKALEIFRGDKDFEEIETAYKILSNPVTKGVYDLYLNTYKNHVDAIKEALFQQDKLKPTDEKKAHPNPPPPQQKSTDKYPCLKHGLFACKNIGMVLGLTTMVTANVQMGLCIAALVNAKNEALLKGSLGQSSLDRVGEINTGTVIGIAVDLLVLLMYVWHKHSQGSGKTHADSSTPATTATSANT